MPVTMSSLAYQTHRACIDIHIFDYLHKSSKMAHFVFKCNKEDYLSLDYLQHIYRASSMAAKQPPAAARALIIAALKLVLNYLRIRNL
jgi:hypothetical protein